MIDTKTLLDSAVHWFITMKAPDLKEKVDIVVKLIKNKEPLKADHKKFIGFILFDYAMRFGPPTFVECEKAAAEMGCLEEMATWARDWIKYSEKNKTT